MNRPFLLTLIFLMSTNIINATDQYSIIYNIPVSSINISSCGNLNQANSVYILNSNISSTGTCFTIGANNIILEGKGYTVNYTTTSAGYGILDSGGYDNITIKNLNLIQKNAGVRYAHGIYFLNVADSRIENISISTQGLSSLGIYLASSSSNYFSGFNITTSNVNADGIYSISSINNEFTVFNITTANSNGLYMITSNNNTISNWNISALGTSAYGIYINGNYNIFSNINVTSGNIGLYINLAGYNTVKGGSVVSSVYDYYLRNIGDTNSFIKTNFTTRKVYLYDNISSFNYNNEINNGVWLNTTQIISPSSNSKITRALINWSQTNTSWREKLSASRKFRYSMNGLFANTNYSVWNDGIIVFNLTTNGNGNLPVFEINISTSEKMISIVPK